MGTRILVNDGLELFSGRRGALLGRCEAVRSRLLGHARRTHLRFKRPDRRRKLSASLFILSVDVIPPAKCNSRDNDDRYYGGNQFGLMLRRPVGGVSRRLECDHAEAVLFQLMPGFCAHRLPSSLKLRLGIVQSNRRGFGWAQAACWQAP